MLRDLVDGHLLGTLSMEEQQRLLAMIEKDPTVAQYVRESEMAFASIQAAKRRLLRQQLQDWDKEAEKNTKGHGGWYALIWILLGLFFLFSWIGYYYSPDRMAQRSFERTLTISSSTQAFDPVWREGNHAFRQGAYEKAIQDYQALLQSSDPDFIQRSTWLILLCQFAMDGPTPVWQNEIQRFSRETPSVYQKEADRLIQTMHSPTYIYLYRNVFGRSMASWQPKII